LKNSHDNSELSLLDLQNIEGPDPQSFGQLLTTRVWKRRSEVNLRGYEAGLSKYVTHHKYKKI